MIESFARFLFDMEPYGRISRPKPKAKPTRVQTPPAQTPKAETPPVHTSFETYFLVKFLKVSTWNLDAKEF